MGYLPFVDGLRAVAILAVVIYHAMPGALPGGFAGVDVFFVISGFLITRFIVSEIDDGSFSLGKFFVRRARRLLPAALVCFLIVTVLSAFVLLPDAFWYFGRSLLGAVLMFANFFFYNTGGYFTAPDLEKPLLHTWSLAVEDQFYVTWPLLLMLAAPRLSRRALIALALAALAASLAFAEYKVRTDAEYAFFLLPTRAWELLLGCVVALGFAPRNLTPTTANALAGAGLVAILASFVLLSPRAHFPGLGALPACLGTAMIIAASLNRENAVRAALSIGPMVFIGLLSYSLYLWHWPLIALSSYHLERALSVSDAIGVVAVSFGVAYLSWRYVERPFRASPEHGGAAALRAPMLSAADKRFVVGALTGVALCVGAAGGLKIFKGLPQRYDSTARMLLQQMVTGNPLRSACDDHQNIFRNDTICNFGRKKAPGASYEVALFGDSMADHWGPLVAKYAEENNLAGRQVTNGGCGLLFGVEIPAWPLAKLKECSAYQTEAEKFLAANPGLKVAVISGFWEKWLGRLEDPAQRVDVPVNRVSDADGDPTPKFTAAMDSTLKAFTDRGVKVVLIGQIPIYSPLPVRCIVKAAQAGLPGDTCGMSRDSAFAQLKRSDEALKRAASRHPGVSVSLPSDYMCQETRCSPFLDGRFLYKNDGHVNQAGAETLRKYVTFPSLP